MWSAALSLVGRLGPLPLVGLGVADEDASFDICWFGQAGACASVGVLCARKAAQVQRGRVLAGGVRNAVLRRAQAQKEKKAQARGHLNSSKTARRPEPVDNSKSATHACANT